MHSSSGVSEQEYTASEGSGDISGSEMADEVDEAWMGDLVEEEAQEVAGSKRGYWLFDTVNANAWGADETGGRGRGAMEYLRRSHADVVGIQETRLDQEWKCLAGMAAAKRAKWKVRLPRADTTHTGYSSAGVGVACRSHFGMAVPNVEGVTCDSARITHAHVGVMCRGGGSIVLQFTWSRVRACRHATVPCSWSWQG